MAAITWFPTPKEGAEIYAFVVGSPGTWTGTLNYTFSGPGLNATGTQQINLTTNSGASYITIRVPDNSAVGNGTYTVTGTLNAGGAPSVINQSGTITDNDNANFTVNLSSQATAYYNIARLPSSAALPAALQIDPFFEMPIGDLTPSQRRTIAKIDAFVDTTTSVAVTAYQFFTGKIPSLGGLDFLVNPSTNANSLNSPYYTDFNAENRYINFAANLGLIGEGKDAFAVNYAALSVNEAIRKAYIEIVGAVNEAGIAAIQGSTGYFQQIASERMGTQNQNLATKAAAIGYILREAVKADVGAYAHALESFYLDLTDGAAQTGVSLIGVYGAGTFLDGIN